MSRQQRKQEAALRQQYQLDEWHEQIASDAARGVHPRESIASIERDIVAAKRRNPQQSAELDTALATLKAKYR